MPSPTLAAPPADPAAAAAFFRARLTHFTDVADVHTSIAGGRPGFVLLDARNRIAWEQGHVPGAVHLPVREITGRAPGLPATDVPVVTYCWGPGCDGATRAALALAELGYRVKEMLGGFEYWMREGFGIETAGGRIRRPADLLTAPCGC